MRLGQLARRLALRPAEIVEFLSQNNITVDEGTNARLDDAYVALIIKKLAPNYKEEVITEPEEKTEPVKSPEAEVPFEIIAETSIEVPATATEANEISTPIPQVIEVIKAPKVELSGLKVLGKIELPEKKKEVKPDTPETPDEKVDTPKIESKPTREVRRTPVRKNERNDARPRKNPITLQREREALEEQERRRANAKLEKERRTEYYLRKVKSSVPTKAAKLVEEPLEQMSPSELKEDPKTLLGKFLRWLTT